MMDISLNPEKSATAMSGSLLFLAFLPVRSVDLPVM